MAANFSNDFRGADLAMPCDEVLFGNMIRKNTFLAHYKIDPTAVNKMTGTTHGTFENMEHYFEGTSVDLDSKYTIFTNFEHDHQKLTVIFPLHRKRIKDKNVETIVCVCKLEIHYQSIRRVFCKIRKDKSIEHNDNEGRTHLYFHVRSPPLISLCKFEREPARMPVEPMELRTHSGDRCVHWQPPMATHIGGFFRNDVGAVANAPYIKITFPVAVFKRCLHVFDRLREATNGAFFMDSVADKVIGKSRALPTRLFNSYQDVERIGGKAALVKMRRNDDPRFHYAFSPLDDRRWRDVFVHNKKLDNKMCYAFDALMSRGAHFCDQLLVEKGDRDAFMDAVETAYKEQRHLALAALERLLRAVDETEQMEEPLVVMLASAVDEARRTMFAAQGDNSKHALESGGYIRLRTAVITPTRIRFYTPEWQMSNRVLRTDDIRWPSNRFLRVVYRDEDDSKLDASSGQTFVRYFLENTLRKGIRCADKQFHYLGESNAQLRDRACYFMNATTDEVKELVAYQGDFSKVEKLQEIGKLFGQCFTQTFALGDDIDPRKYAITMAPAPLLDENANAEPTICLQTDCVSQAFAMRVAREMKLGTGNVEAAAPSGFSYMFRGYKGVHGINTQLDQYKKWMQFGSDINESKLQNGDSRLAIDMRIGEMPSRYNTTEEAQKYEIVKLAAPQPALLSRQMINAIDQAAEAESVERHQSVRSRIYEIVDRGFGELSSSLTDEKHARHILGRMPRILHFDAIRTLALTCEPFWSALLYTNAQASLSYLRRKQKIAVPMPWGRSMLGVVDMSGVLSADEVFVQYSRYLYRAHDESPSSRRVASGSLLVTKNPMVFTSDMRVYKAVNRPYLEHHCDVIVFSRSDAERLNNGVMNSDVTGDEFSVIWDPRLIVNTDLAMFKQPNPTDPVLETFAAVNLQEQLANHFIDYVSSDMIGKMANGHLVMSDAKGFKDEWCSIIETKLLRAINYARLKPDDLELEKDKTHMSKPPECKADFMDHRRNPAYQSQRINGHVYRRSRDAEASFALLPTSSEKLETSVTLDAAFLLPDVGEAELEKARLNYEQYATAIDNLLYRFGIKTEAEMFAGSVPSKPTSDCEHDDRSFFSTCRLVQEELERICAFHRCRFLGSFEKNWRDWVTWSSKSTRDELVARVILGCKVEEAPPREMLRLASAYYKIAYSQNNRRHLSFAWLVSDVLAHVQAAHDAKSPPPPSSSSVVKKLAKNEPQSVVDTFVVEKSGRKFDDNMRAQLIEDSQCTNIAFRGLEPRNKFSPESIAVMATGDAWTVNKLRSLLLPNKPTF